MIADMRRLMERAVKREEEEAILRKY